MQRKKKLGEKVTKLLRLGYTPTEITQRMAVSYNYAWKLKKDLEAAAKEGLTEVKRVVGTMERKVPSGPATVVRHTAQNEAIARIASNRHEVPEHQQHLITEHEWDGYHERVWCVHGIDQLGEMCEVCYPETVAKPKPGEYVEVQGAKSAQEIDAILNARAANYGSFATQAKIAQRLKHVAHTAAGEQGKAFAHDQAEALDMIFGKIARIVNGDPNHLDSWIDIAGYATLVADRLQGKSR
jgi:hypothetical protein